jgi:hypothetical protein
MGYRPIDGPTNAQNLGFREAQLNHQACRMDLMRNSRSKSDSYAQKSSSLYEHFAFVAAGAADYPAMICIRIEGTRR